MELPPRVRRIYIWWVESDQMITFIPYSASKGGEIETTVLWIEDNNSTVGMEKDVIVDLSGCGNRLALGFYERGCGSTREVHRVLRDAVEGYDRADAEFWYQRFFDIMADMPGYYMSLKVHVAQMLLFGHTRLPERGWGPEGDEEYAHNHAHEYGYGYGYEYEHEHTHGESSQANHERHERSQQTREQYQEYRQGQREQYQQYKEQQKQQYDEYKRQEHQQHSRHQSYTAPQAPLRKSELVQEPKQQRDEYKQQHIRRRSHAAPEPMHRRKSRVGNWREDMIFDEMKAKDRPLYEFCKKNGIKIPKRR